MTKSINEYTQEELNEIAKKVVAQRQKDADKAKVTRELYAAYKAGLIKLPK